MVKIKSILNFLNPIYPFHLIWVNTIALFIYFADSEGIKFICLDKLPIEYYYVLKGLFLLGVNTNEQVVRIGGDFLLIWGGLFLLKKVEKIARFLLTIVWIFVRGYVIISAILIFIGLILIFFYDDNLLFSYSFEEGMRLIGAPFLVSLISVVWIYHDERSSLYR